MNNSIEISVTKVGSLILITSFLVFLPSTHWFQNAPSTISLGILLDLLITIPILYYFIVRKKDISNFTVIYVFIFCLILGRFIIPSEYQDLLNKIKIIAIPILELGIISMVIIKMASLRSSLQKKTGNDFYDKVLLACEEIFPKHIAQLFATELAVFYYLFISSNNNTIDNNSFSYFKKSGIKIIVTILLFLIIAETVVLHYLLSQWNSTIALILTVMSIYAMIQIIAILKSMNHRLITIDEKSEKLILRYRFGTQTKIPFVDIPRARED